MTFTQPGLEGLRISAYQPSPMMLQNVNTSRGNSHHNAANTIMASTNSQTHFDRDGVDGPALQAVAVGNIITQLSDSLFAVDFHDSFLPPVHIGARVYVAYAVPQGTLRSKTN